MITSKQSTAALGFAFVAAWIGFGFGSGVLCLVGAGVFYFAAAYREGDLDLGELGERLSSGPSAPSRPPARTGAARVR